MSWNIVLNKFVEIKQKFIDKFGSEVLWNYENEESCLEYWVRMLDIDEYINLIAPLQLNEFEDKLLIRYANFASAFAGEGEINFGDFWTLHDGFYMECRSLVINIKEDEIVLSPFRKFRNINECEENSEENIRKRIEKAKSIEFTDKLDGSMQSARWYRGKLVMSGSQALDQKSSFRLADGYRMMNENPNYIQFLQDYKDETGIFEYISLKDQHVVKYTKEQEGLYFIGMRNTITGKEASYSEIIQIAKKYGMLSTSMHNQTLDSVMSSLDSKKSDEAEGFVLNIDGYKVKIKYNDYINMHGILSVMSSPNIIIRHIADDTWDDFISKVPLAYKERVMSIANKIFLFIKLKENKVSDYFQELIAENLETKKEAMLWINSNVPKMYQGYVRAKYLDTPYNYIKASSGRYVIMKDIEKYLEKEQ